MVEQGRGERGRAKGGLYGGSVLQYGGYMKILSFGTVASLLETLGSHPPPPISPLQTGVKGTLVPHSTSWHMCSQLGRRDTLEGLTENRGQYAVGPLFPSNH